MPVITSPTTLAVMIAPAGTLAILAYAFLWASPVPGQFATATRSPPAPRRLPLQPHPPAGRTRDHRHHHAVMTLARGFTRAQAALLLRGIRCRAREACLGGPHHSRGRGNRTPNLRFSPQDVG